MSNAIIYSLHSDNPKLDSLVQWRQLRHSIDTLRSVNKEIDIKVYISPVGVLQSAILPIDKTNLEFIEFNAIPYEGFLDQKISRLIAHKWESSFDAHERFDFDNVMYVDTDVIWNKDPEVIFDKYGYTESIYSKQDKYESFIEFLKPKGIPMNDGINLISKKAIKHKDHILKSRASKVIGWQNKHIDADDEMMTNGIQWAACQYAVSEAMFEIGNPIKFFDHQDVLLASEMDDLGETDHTKCAAFHYLNNNTNQFLPNKYKIAPGYQTEIGKILKITRDGVTVKCYDDTVQDVTLEELFSIIELS